jgi:hypothetical protein
VAGTKGFRAGDHWVFAARTSDASVEALDVASPRGIHHHYARLAIWQAGTNNEPTDCRHKWPPAGGADCSCTQCVTPESHASGQLTIQEAVNRIQESGGTVCLHEGQYVLSEPVRLTNTRSVRIKGQGPATLIAAPLGAFSIEGGFGIRIENLAVLSLALRPTIAIRSGAGIALHDLALLAPANNPDAQSGAIALSGFIAGLTIRDNLIVAPRGVLALDSRAPEPQLDNLVTAALRIEDNVLWCDRLALELAGTVGHFLTSSIARNELLGCRQGGIVLTGFAFPGASMRIENNTLNVNGPGISCAVDGAWIQGNKVVGVTQGDRQVTGSGISLLTGLDLNGSDQCQLLANQVSGFPFAGILISAPVQNLICKLNIIEKCAIGIAMANAAAAGYVSIENNHLSDIGRARASLVFGIIVTRALSASIVGNTLRRIGADAVPGTALIVGVGELAVRRSRVTGNTITEVGPATPLAGAFQAGILLQGPYSQNDISGNHVERDAEPGAGADAAFWSALVAVEPSAATPVVSSGNFTTVHLSPARMLVLNDTHAFVEDLALDANAAAGPIPRGSSAAVRGNVFMARGSAAAVSVTTGADIQFGDNRCELVGGRPAVELTSSAAIVSANLIRGGEVSLQLNVGSDRYTLVGNATTRAIRINQGTPAGTPWERLNVII